MNVSGLRSLSVTKGARRKDEDFQESSEGGDSALVPASSDGAAKMFLCMCSLDAILTRMWIYTGEIEGK